MRKRPLPPMGTLPRAKLEGEGIRKSVERRV
jgi:hypothetical protein